MTESVIPLDLGVTWDPNGPEAVLMTGDGGRTTLALTFDRSRDTDRRAVVLVWEWTYSATMGSPNDEAIAGHRLYGHGLEKILWAGAVDGSELIADLERRNRVHERHNPARFRDLVHHIVRTKEDTVEVVAEKLSVHRLEGGTIEAAATAMRMRL